MGLEISAVERLGDTSATKERQKMAVWGDYILTLNHRLHHGNKTGDGCQWRKAVRERLISVFCHRCSL